MSLIVDASVAVRWYLPEDGVAAAVEILQRDHDLGAPELILAEIGNAVWKRVRIGEVETADAVEIVERARVDFAFLVPMDELATPAMRHAAELDHPIYDCFYLALAEREQAALVTTDRRLAALVERAGVSVELIG
jgi:predicted nucleic acid-binding protein